MKFVFNYFHLAKSAYSVGPRYVVIASYFNFKIV